MYQPISTTQQNTLFPPILDIYVVWHPGDTRGGDIAEKVIEHFRGAPFTGLISGAIEVFVRSEGWQSSDDCPRPIPSVDEPLPNGLQKAKFIAVVPILDIEMANAVEVENSPWHRYMKNIVHLKKSQEIQVLSYCLDPRSTDGTILGELLGCYQNIAANSSEEQEAGILCRNLVQGIAQFLAQKKLLTVFISYTKSNASEENTIKLMETVRQIVTDTHLQSFCDVRDLQPGCDWDSELRNKAAKSALLALRTDLYSSREWCQREISVSKHAGMPIVIVDALKSGEERGSFLMDHVPRIPARMENNNWNKKDVFRALNVLVDEHLKRILWAHQHEALQAQFEIDWWSPHAPELLTFVQWLKQQRNAEKKVPINGKTICILHPFVQWLKRQRNAERKVPINGKTIRILHPEPPLGPEEQDALVQVISMSGVNCKLDIRTPRSLIGLE